MEGERSYLKTMALNEHPDYEYETRRLNYTKAYIKGVLNKNEQNKTEYQENMKQAMEELDFLDSSQSYITILTNAKFFDVAERDYHNLQKIKDKPYFCRIDFKPDEAPHPEKLYIGKTSLYRDEDQAPVIVDWRSPIANLYYEGRLGETTYDTENGAFSGELSLKRQYMIEDGELKDIQDVDITARDELLQKALGSSAENRLKDIVSTIQAEQNRIIRAKMDTPLIVQGVAGSGKTTIALHRIAYFIYTYADRFDPDQFMILAPNALFLNYISEVLPELGVDAVTQTTFSEFVLSLIGKKYKLTHSDDKLLSFVNEEKTQDHERLQWVSHFKGSMAFKELIDRYVNAIEQTLVPDTDFTLGSHVLYSAEDIQRLFFKDYSYLPLYKRVNQIQNVLSNHLKTKKKDILQAIEESYDEKIEQARYSIRDPEKRRNKIVPLLDERDQQLKTIQDASKSLVKDYIAQFPKYDLYDYYNDLMTQKDRLRQCTDHHLTEQQIDDLCRHSSALLQQKKIEFEDTAALLYLKQQIFGFKKKLSIKNVVIDEAQDFSIFQLFTLKTVLNTQLFTILGDLSQGIHAYRGITDWNEMIEKVFPNTNANYMTLKQSYRTTVEIMNMANEVIQKSTSPGIIPAEPVVRHGEKPYLYTFEEPDGYVGPVIEQIHKMKADGFQSIAIIGKSLNECKKIQKQLSKKTDLTMKLLNDKATFADEDVVIVPSYMAKGLEFDAVFILAVEDAFTRDDLDIKLLYIAMTRALHSLSIYQRKNSIPWWDDIPAEVYQRKSV